MRDETMLIVSLMCIIVLEILVWMMMQRKWYMQCCVQRAVIIDLALLPATSNTAQ
jgi:hypothetical protein